MRCVRSSFRPVSTAASSAIPCNTVLNPGKLIPRTLNHCAKFQPCRTLFCSSRTRLLSKTSDRVHNAMNSGFGPDPETVTYLRDPNSNREVYLIGTAHVSQQSADDVKELIDLVKPSCVMIELCPARADRIRKEGSEAADFFTIASKAMAGNKGDFFEGLLRTALASFYNIFRQMGMVPGNEFKIAMETAEKLNIQIVYGDRSGDQTMHKLREALGKLDIQRFMMTKPPPELEQFFAENFSRDFKQGVEKLKDRKRIAMMSKYMESAAPEVMKVMLTERDEFMVDSILKSCPQGRTVAVVGMAHMDGMERVWAKRTKAKFVSK